MLIDLININYDSLNENDHHVLNYIVNNVEICTNSTLVEIARYCNVSASTISRTTQKLGFDGFTHFKYYLEKELEREVNERSIISGAFQSSILLSDFSETVSFFEQNKNLDRIYELILNSDRIFAFGTGYAQNLMIQEFARCLLNNNIFLNILATKTELALIQERLKVNDLLFVVSLSGNIEQIKPILNNIVVQRVPIVSVTLFSRNDLAYLADYNLYYHVTSFNTIKNLNNSSFFTLNLVFALLYEGLTNYVVSKKTSLK